MRGLVISLGIIAFGVVSHGAWAADATPADSVVTPAPLSQSNDPSDRVAGARVTDPDGKAVGAVQKVELRDGMPARLDIALLGSERIVTIDASTVRYDASTNVVTASQGAGQLLARPQN
jgi:hypothetical protein